MAINLLDMLSNTIGSQLTSQGSRLLGESSAATQSAVGAILPTILAGVMKQGSTADGAAGLMKLLTGPTVDGGLAANVAGALGNSANTNALMMAGGDMLKTLFGDKVAAVASSISSTAGVKSSSAINLLSLALPMVLSFLKNHVATKGLNAGGLMNLLAGQSGFLQDKLDNRITQAAGFGDASRFLANISGAASRSTGAVAAAGAGTAAAVGYAADRARGVAGDAAQATIGATRAAGRATADMAMQTAEAAQDAGAGMRKFLPWIIGLIVLAALFFLLRNQTGDRKVTEAPAVAGTAAKAPTVAGTAPNAPTVAGNAAKTLSLPGGATLNVPSGGFIESIYAFLSSKDAGVGTGYALDKVAFETGSATLTSASNQQLTDLAAVLKAFQTATVSVNGYTDNTGDAAANTALSAQRAEVVKSTLVDRGVAADRIAAAGFGPNNPIASNDTEEGKAKNRRVEIVVTKR